MERVIGRDHLRDATVLPPFWMHRLKTSGHARSIRGGPHRRLSPARPYRVPATASDKSRCRSRRLCDHVRSRHGDAIASHRTSMTVYPPGKSVFDCRPAPLQPNSGAAMTDVAATEPHKSRTHRWMAEQKVVVLRHQDQFVLLDVVSDLWVGRLPAQFAANVRRRSRPRFKSTARSRRQLRVDQPPHQAACTTV